MRVSSYAHDWDTICLAAHVIGVRPAYARARCPHGKTQHEWCTPCQGGYDWDGHTYYYPRSDVALDASGEYLAADSDDGEDVVYVPARYQTRLLGTRNPAPAQPCKVCPYYEDGCRIAGGCYLNHTT